MCSASRKWKNPPPPKDRCWSKSMPPRPTRWIGTSCEPTPLSPAWGRVSGGPKINRLGADLAGVVETVGAGVSEFKPGDAVFGSIGAGGFAEYACAAEKYFVHKPANVSFAAAAATPIVGLTAIQGMRDYGHIQSGQKVLVNGASGGIGTFAVQYAKALGAEVTGVTSTRNLELVRSIGADHVVDYTQTDFSQTGQQYDLIFDTIGNISMSAARRALKAKGRCVVAGFTTLRHIAALGLFGNLKAEKAERKIGMMGTAEVKKPDLSLIQELLATGKLVPVIDRTYPLHETAQAIAYLEQGHALWQGDGVDCLSLRRSTCSKPETSGWATVSC